MATGNLLDTKTVSLNEIIGNGKIYKVPQFQRDYSWGQDNWDDLWNDIEIAEKSKSLHYMGSVVLQNSKGKDFYIIDGQQRFTTLSIVILTVISFLDELVKSEIDVDENKERMDLLMRQYIGQKDPASLNYSPKLFLNENNNSFYQTRLISLKEPINERKLSDSEKLMWQAFLFFQNKIKIKFKEKKGIELARFLNNTVGELIMFIQITVEDELDAYNVFETLNSRGIELTSTDLLKNYLFSLVSKSQTDLKIVKSQWKKIIDTVGLKDFPVFLRYFLIATRKQVSKEYLFKEVKNYIKSAEDVFGLLDHLEYYAYNYVTLGNADDEQWNTDKESRNAIYILKEFRVTQWKLLALVAFEKLDIVEFKKLLNSIITISFRYNVIAKLQTNEMEKVYSKAAIRLYKGESKKLQEVLFDLSVLYVNDDDFKNYFALKQFNTNNSQDKKLLRYTLYKIEGQNIGGSLFDFDSDNGTIEHILPESYPEIWHEQFTEEEFERNVFMLGNLTLLEPSKNNKEASNLSFDTKLEVFKLSKYSITNSILGSEWTANSIKLRQMQLAKVATSVWKIQF